MTATKITAETIADTQIEQLSTEAAEAGDVSMVEICNSALGGNDGHRAHCAHVINKATAMDDGDVTAYLARF